MVEKQSPIFMIASAYVFAVLNTVIGAALIRSAFGRNTSSLFPPLEKKDVAHLVPITRCGGGILSGRPLELTIL